MSSLDVLEAQLRSATIQHAVGGAVRRGIRHEEMVVVLADTSWDHGAHVARLLLSFEGCAAHESFEGVTLAAALERDVALALFPEMREQIAHPPSAGIRVITVTEDASLSWERATAEA